MLESLIITLYGLSVFYSVPKKWPVQVLNPEWEIFWLSLKKVFFVICMHTTAAFRPRKSYILYPLPQIFVVLLTLIVLGGGPCLCHIVDLILLFLSFLLGFLGLDPFLYLGPNPPYFRLHLFLAPHFPLHFIASLWPSFSLPLLWAFFVFDVRLSRFSVSRRIALSLQDGFPHNLCI